MTHTVSRTTKVFSFKYFSGLVQDVTLPNGVECSIFTLQHPGAVVILPITASGSVLLVSQYRPSIEESILELPAGTLEKDELPSSCAAREIIEETGFAARELIPLGQLVPAPGFCNEVQWCFVARDLYPADAQQDDDEIISVVEVPITDLPGLITSGKLRDGKSLALILKAQAGGYFPR